MITKEIIVEIIRKETWLEVDSASVYGIEEATEKILQAIKADEQSVQADIACTCAKNDLVDLVMYCSNCGGKVPQSR
jgi:hypothetical protein